MTFAITAQNTATLAETFSAGAAAFLFIDVQYDYFDEDRLRYKGVREPVRTYLSKVATRIGRFTTAARMRTGDLGAIFAVHTINRQLRYCSKDSLRTELVVPTIQSDTILPKQNYCAFDRTDLADNLKKRAATTLVIGGGILEHCVSATIATATRTRDLNIVLMPDLTASNTQSTDIDTLDRALAGIDRARVTLMSGHEVLKAMPRPARVRGLT